MKRIITAVAVIFLMAATSFSQTKTSTKKTDNEMWLDRYEALVKRVQAVAPDSVPEDSISHWRAERANFRSEYKDIYKDFLSDEEDQRYYSLTAKYNKSFANFQLNDAGKELQEVGKKVANGTKKVGNKISGWFKGLKDD